MPIEDIKCEKCGITFNILYEYEDYPNSIEEVCPKCGKQYKGDWIMSIYPVT